MFGEYIGAGSGTTKLLLHLNGNSTDSSGNGNNGTDTAITYVDGKFGKCASFNGSSSKINLPTASLNTALSTAITISMWVKFNATTDGQYLFALNSSPGDSPEIRLKTGYSAGNLTFEWAVYDNNDYQADVSKIIPYDTNWHHVLVVGATNDFRIYIDNSLGTTATSGSFNIDNIGELALGRYSYGVAYFNGSMDEVIIENRAWTASEVKKYYTNSLGRF